MKIQCEVCDKDEASVFCVADEAALCSACDHRVHHANKLAEKHKRFSLHHPDPNQAPKCDICQDKRGLLFCQQDRAILCRDCDVSIHKANKHTQKHMRFLLTGVKLSANSWVYSSSSSASSEVCTDSVPVMKPQKTRSINSASVHPTTSSAKSTIGQSTPMYENSTQLTSGVDFSDSISTSSISEYLIETLPGWHVEDFLDSSSPTSFFKNGENEVMSFWDADMENNNNNLSHFASGRTGLWVPQAPPPMNQNQSYHHHHQSSIDISFGAPNVSKEFSTYTDMKSGRRWNEENSLTVPQINPSSTSFKRSRTLW